jgi:hypothetical protein
MTNKIWYEMVNMKYGEIYLTKYLGLQRNFKKAFQIMTLVVSASGILGWKYFENYAWIAFLLIIAMQLLLLVENQLIRSDKEMEEISKLRILYIKYFVKLEKLWFDFYSERITENESTDKYFRLRNDEWVRIEELDCKLDIKRDKRLMNQTEIETNHYINRYHYE